MRTGTRIKLTVLLSALFLPLAGCGDDGPLEQLDHVEDCFTICDRYQECVDSSFDITACTDACEDLADDDTVVQERLDRCDDCLDDRSCQEVETVACFDDCPVVPLED